MSHFAIIYLSVLHISYLQNLGSRFQAKVIRILEHEDKVANMVAGHGCWSIGPKLFQPEPYPARASSKLLSLLNA